MRNRGLDITLSILFTLVLVAAAGVLEVMSVMLPMVTDSCGVRNCNEMAIPVGIAVWQWGVPLVALAFVIGTIVASARRRPSWYVPLAGILAVGVVAVVALMVLAFSIEGSFGS
jgi:uncharacterized BrkB/YihY/UPF0761 family membrane protein